MTNAFVGSRSKSAGRKALEFAAFTCLALALGSKCTFAQSPDTDYVALIERAAQNEVQALQSPACYEYRERLLWSWGSETRQVIETPEGRADRIVSFDDGPMAADQQARQQHRLEKLLRDGGAARDEVKDQHSEAARRIKMMDSFAQAFLFDFEGKEPGGHLRFSFKPDPDFSPKDRETQMYRGMEGELWVDPIQERMVRIDGTLVKDVSFGWGIFGRIYKGGKYEIAQRQVAPGTWRVVLLNVDMKGRSFLFGSFHLSRKESNSNFRRAPSDLSYQDALQKLLEDSAPLPLNPVRRGVEPPAK